MKIILCLLTTLVIGVNAFCSTADSLVRKQDSTFKLVKTKVYRINYFVEGAVICVGMVGDILAIPRLKSKASLADTELLFANSDAQKNLINTIDRWALKQPTSDRATWKKIS